MNHNFKVGDRVKVYGYVDQFPETGTIINNEAGTPDGHITVRCDETKFSIFPHPKQCRRLVPKKKNWKWMYQPIVGNVESDQLYSTIKLALAHNDGVMGYRKVRVYLKDAK